MTTQSAAPTESPEAGLLTPRWTAMRPHAEQWRLWQCRSRFVAAAAGRGSGKTELAKRRLVLALSVPKPWPDPRYFFGAPTEKQAKRIAWQDLLDLVPDWWIVGGKRGHNVNRSELVVHTRFGASLHVVGLDQPARIEGVQWDGCVLDESSDLKPGTFDRNVSPALRHRRGWCWRIGVPKRAAIGAREFREFFERCARGEYPDGAAFTWLSAGILSPAEIEQAREAMDPKDFAEQYEARWETAGGAVFHAFDRAYNVRPCPYAPAKPIVVGCDFNVDPMCWAIGHRYEDRLEWFDEIFLRNANTPGTLAVLHQRYASHRSGFEFYGDASSQSRKTSAVATDYQQILNHAGFRQLGRTVHVPPSNPAIRDRFSATNALLCNADGDRRMFVDPRCVRLIADLEARYYRPGASEPADSGDLGHITDAVGYAVMRLFPPRLDRGRGEARVVITQGSR